MNLKKLMYMLLLLINLETFSLSAISYPALFTIPKCGSNLLIKVFLAITGFKTILGPPKFFLLDDKTIKTFLSKPTIFSSHAIYIDENIKKLNPNIKKIFIYRDPRDQIVSAAFWIKKVRKFSRSTWAIDKIIDELISGGGSIWSQVFLAEDPWQHLTSIVDFYNLYLPWMFEPNVYVTTFEKLVGPKGGGTEEDQLHEIMAMANHIGKQLSLNDAKRIANNLFGGTTTFREGKIGSWKKHLLPRHITALKKLPGFTQLLIYLGYAENENW